MNESKQQTPQSAQSTKEAEAKVAIEVEAGAEESNIPLVEARDVSKLFPAIAGMYGSRRKFVRAIDRVNLSVDSGEIVGLVGESGCGKSTLGRMMICLEPLTDGSVMFEGREISKYHGRKLRAQRSRMQIIFQDPASSLNPSFTVRDTLMEAIKAQHKRLNRRNRTARLAALLSMVGLPVSSLDKYPREFSGGERQRVAIARALAVEPQFIVADEPISSLDLTTQAQIIKLIDDLRNELGFSFLLISHDLDVIKHLSTKTAVMYLGRILESAPTKKLFSKPRHPYTKALIASILSIDPDDQSSLTILSGDPPSPLSPPSGCHFHPRCPHAETRCELVEPPMRAIDDGRHIKCHFDLFS